ncbi:DUF1444 family protein [Pyxidicoccus sp. 3LG]
MAIPLFPDAARAADMPKDLSVQISDPKLDEARFTSLCAEVLRVVEPQAKVSVVGSFRVAVTSQGVELVVGFENPWRAPPAGRADAVWTQAQGLNATVQAALGKASGQLAEIVPLVRGEVDAAVQAIIAGKYNQIGERLVGDLWVLYAFNKPTLFMPVTDVDLQRLKLDKAKLRSLALGNLRKQIPPIEKKGSSGTWMFILPETGGNFEASLLLLDEVWDGKGTALDGEPMVAVPARDLLFVTGTHNEAGVQKVKDLAAHAFDKVDHPVSKKVLVRRKGKWEIASAM